MLDETMSDLDQLCETAVAHGASDILLHEGRVPCMRVGGELVLLETAPVEAVLLGQLRERCGVGSASDWDAAVTTGMGRRFRVNIFRAMGGWGAALRLVRSEIPEMDALGLPAGLLQRMAVARQGLILICGPAGSGKSTTLAAILGWLNTSLRRHVVTVEDPVEFAFVDHACVFTQREVGVDTPSFAEGLRRLLRQSPDVVLIGEIRDAETAAAALSACETGHLVLASLHAPGCRDALERLAGFFVAEMRAAARLTLASQLLGAVCQRLLPARTGGMLLACEYMANVGAIPKLVAEGRWGEFAELLERGDGGESRSLLNALAALVAAGFVDEEVASLSLPHPQELTRRLRGISSAAGTTRR
jgi:twitching motility protein PilT